MITIVDNGKDYSSHALYFVQASMHEVERVLAYQFVERGSRGRMTVVGHGDIQFVFSGQAMTLETFATECVPVECFQEPGVQCYGGHNDAVNCALLRFHGKAPAREHDAPAAVLRSIVPQKTLVEYRRVVREMLDRDYGITLDDAGLDDAALAEAVRDDMPANGLVVRVAEKYGLEPIRRRGGF